MFPVSTQKQGDYYSSGACYSYLQLPRGSHQYATCILKLIQEFEQWIFAMSTKKQAFTNITTCHLICLGDLNKIWNHLWCIGVIYSNHYHKISYACYFRWLCQVYGSSLMLPVEQSKVSLLSPLLVFPKWLWQYQPVLFSSQPHKPTRLSELILLYNPH